MAIGNVNKDLGFANFFTGIGDGLVIPCIAGILALALAAQASTVIWVLLLSTIFGALAFGIARYSGEIAEIEHNHPLLSATESEKEQLMMAYIGIDTGLRLEMESEMAEEKDFWLKEIRENDLDWNTINKKRALKGAWQTGLSFLTGGLLSSVIFLTAMGMYPAFSLKFFLAAVVPLLLLTMLAGGWKAHFTGRHFLKGALFSLVYSLFSLSMPALIAWLLIAQS